MNAENVIPLNPESKAYHEEIVAFFDGLAQRFRNNEIATISVNGVDRDGDPFRFDVVPIEDRHTLRLLMLGLLTEAASEYTSPFEAE